MERRWLPSPADGLVVLDTDAAPDPAWTPYRDCLRVILCQANEVTGPLALAALPASDHNLLLANTLSNRNGAAKFHITRDPTKSSLLAPDLRRVKPFANAAGFEMTGESSFPRRI